MATDDTSVTAGAPAAAGWGPPLNAVYLFDHDGRRIAAGLSADDTLQPPVGRLSDLAERYQEVDGLALDTGQTGRRLAIERASGARVLVALEQLIEDDTAGRRCTVVGVLAFEDEQENALVRRALGSVLAHELRTPLTSIFMAADLLEASSTRQELVADIGATIARQARRLHGVTEDLVVVTRLERLAEADMAPVLLHRMLPARARQLSMPAERLAWALPAGLQPVMADAERLGHAFGNMLDNALAFAPPDSHIRITARAGAGEEVVLIVEDDGPPFDGSEGGEAFELFGRGARVGRDASGANLRLYVARRLIASFGGQIAAGASSSRGGRMTITLAVA